MSQTPPVRLARLTDIEAISVAAEMFSVEEAGFLAQSFYARLGYAEEARNASSTVQKTTK